MKIKDFIKDRNISYQTVRKYINNHKTLFEGHVGKKNNIILDEVAIELLNQKYPKGEIVEVIEDRKNYDELIKVKEQLMAAQKMIIELQSQILEVAPRLAEAEAFQYLLDIEKTKAAENEIKIKKNEKVINYLQSELDNKDNLMIDLENTNKILELENNELKNRSLLSRLRNDMPNIKADSCHGKYNTKVFVKGHREAVINKILNGEE